MRYYFDINDGEALYADEEGMGLKGQTAADIEAGHSLADAARNFSPLEGRHHLAVEVRTSSGPVFRAGFIFEAKQ